MIVFAAYDRREGWLQWDAKSCAHWLNWRCGVSLRTAREQVRVARALEHLPLLRETFMEGRISYSKVRAISRVADEFKEDELVDLALESTASQIEKVCVGIRRSNEDEDGQAKTAVDEQNVRFENNYDGTVCLIITVPTADAKQAYAQTPPIAMKVVVVRRLRSTVTASRLM